VEQLQAHCFIGRGQPILSWILAARLLDSTAQSKLPL
jgi:hypothetical protein